MEHIGKEAGAGPLRGLAKLRDCRTRRISSWDRRGGNADFMTIPAGETKVIADIKGAGCTTHIWCTIACEEEYYLRKILLRMYWDGEKDPSVETPMGDFFGMGHGLTKNFISLPLSMGPQDGKAFNCYFPMPFSNDAKIEIVNECNKEIRAFYFYIDYEKYDNLEEGWGRFHAQWRRENPTRGWGDNKKKLFRNGTISDYAKEVWMTSNLKGEGNYLILEAEGRGHYVGCNLNIDCFAKQKNLWYGEGDDMIFIDGDEYPTLHGTGTEDYFNMAWCPKQEYNTPYHGLTLISSENWRGKNSMYRFHIEDPIYFDKSIKVTIEHGHANNLSNDYSSTAYWYQTEPHKKFPAMPPADERLPRKDEKKESQEEGQ